MDRPVFPLNRVVREGGWTCARCGSGFIDHLDNHRGHPFTRRRWREVFEGEYYDYRFSWKLLSHGINLGWRTEGGIRVLTFWWPRFQWRKG